MRFLFSLVLVLACAVSAYAQDMPLDNAEALRVAKEIQAQKAANKDPIKVTVHLSNGSTVDCQVGCVAVVVGKVVALSPVDRNNPAGLDTLTMTLGADEKGNVTVANASYKTTSGNTLTGLWGSSTQTIVANPLLAIGKGAPVKVVPLIGNPIPAFGSFDFSGFAFSGNIGAASFAKAIKIGPYSF